MTNTFTKLSPEKQAAILDAAAYVFARKGYHQANVLDVCKKAGISNGALYKYFKNKEDLYVDVVSSYIDRLGNSYKVFYKSLEETDLSFHDAIDEILKLTPDFIERENDYIKIYHDLGSSSMDEFTSELSQEFEEVSYRFWSKLVERGKRNGEIRKEITPEVAAYMMDNHFSFFVFSCVSEHYAKRFKVFFNLHDEDLSLEGKILLMKRSMIQLLT